MIYLFFLYVGGLLTNERRYLLFFLSQLNSLVQVPVAPARHRRLPGYYWGDSFIILIQTLVAGIPSAVVSPDGGCI